MPKIVDQDAKREEVLDATLRVVLKAGVLGTTMRAIAEEARTSTGTVNHYFADKEAVLVAALRLNQQRTVAALTTRGAAAASGLTGLRSLVDEALPLDDARRARWIVFQSFSAAFPGVESFETAQREGYIAWRDTFRQQMRRAVDHGECKPGLEVTHETNRLIILIVGIAVQATLLDVRRNNAQIARFVDEHIDALRH